MMSPIVSEMIETTLKPNFKLVLWDLAMGDDPNEKGREYKTSFNTGVNAKECFSQLTGIPKHELQVVPDSFDGVNNGKLICAITGMDVAIYKFIPLDI